ncbi:MAG: molybdopterin dinucleotide binding domain-containing protein [Novosphingobium sp.]|nr:molybdopterin dinucleotide binding domain-containing protein [Novosphingobium sp.]
MSGNSSLTEYLIAVLNTICGRWLREGEAVANPGVFLPRATPKAQAAPPFSPVVADEPMRVRGLSLSAAGLPTAALADEILLEGEGKIRALFSTGNPVAGWPDQQRTVDAMEDLELLVQIDVRMSATAQMADYVIAPKVQLEATGCSFMIEAMELYATEFGMPEPFGMFAPAVIDPPAGSDLIEEWEFYYGLAQRMGLELVLPPVNGQLGTLRAPTEPVAIDMTEKPTTDEMFEMITRGARVPLSEVKKHPNGAVFAETIVAVPSDAECVDRLDVGNAAMMAELKEARSRREDQTSDSNYPFQLISRRMPSAYNSSGHDLPTLVRKRGGRYNPAYMHPSDVEILGLKDEDRIVISSMTGSTDGFIKSDPTLRPGLIAMAHAFGGASADKDARVYGSNTGALVSVEDRYDHLSGIPRMSAIPVQVAASAA